MSEEQEDRHESASESVKEPERTPEELKELRRQQHRADILKEYRIGAKNARSDS